jgi:hypothetical protein
VLCVYVSLGLGRRNASLVSTERSSYRGWKRIQQRLWSALGAGGLHPEPIPGCLGMSIMPRFHKSYGAYEE